MTLDERLEALTMNLELAHREILDLQKAFEKLGTSVDERAVAAEQRSIAAEERHDREIARLRNTMRRAVLLGIREARQERARRRELDEKLTQLAAAQLVTEEKLKQFLARYGNGQPPGPPAAQ